MQGPAATQPPADTHKGGAGVAGCAPLFLSTPDQPTRERAGAWLEAPQQGSCMEQRAQGLLLCCSAGCESQRRRQAVGGLC